MFGMKNHFDVSGSIEIRKADTAGVACSSETGTRLYINDLRATATGTVTNLHGFIFQKEINLPRSLGNSIFISTRNSCISWLRM